MTRRDIIGIGGSSGSTEALKTLVAGLAAGLQASVLISTHISGRKTYLVEVLKRFSPLPVRVAQDGEEILPGIVYVAAPDAHLLALDGRFKLGRGPRENMARPAIDPMLRSLALSYGPRAIGVILSGALNDGASGLLAVKQCGGLAVVQSPEDAQVTEMPCAAIQEAQPDHIVPANAIGPLLSDLVGAEAPAAPACPPDVRLEVEIAAGGPLGAERLERLADPVAMTCPNCHGVLSHVREGGPLRYRCQIGHAVTGEILDQTQKAAQEEALRIALRVVEERADLVRTMGKDARRLGRTAVAEIYEAREKEYAAHAQVLRKAVLAGLLSIMENDPTSDSAAAPEPK